MFSVSFTHPYYLLFLFLIPLFIFIHIVTLRVAKTTALRFANFEAIARIRGVEFFSKNVVILSLSVLIVFFFTMALSGITYHTIADASTHSFVIAIDSSQSMEADDFSPNRMDAAKLASLDFIDRMPLATRLGIISFSGNVLIEQDITEDKGLLKTAVKNIEPSGISGTDIYETVVTASNLLRGEENRAIIVLSDGQINVGGIDESIAYANDNDVIIHTIAIGTEEGGTTSYGSSKLNEDSLKSLSYNTGGEFLKAEDNEKLSDSFDKSLKLTKKKVAINLSSYSLIIAILLFSLEFYLINSRYRRLV